jgi:hypothetical protein
MRGVFLVGWCLLLAESGCSGVVAREGPEAVGGASEGPSGAGAGAGGALQGDGGGASLGGAPMDLGCECLPWSLSWRLDGGLLPSPVTSFVEPCASFRQEVQPWDDAPRTSCSSPLPLGCDLALGVADINRALQHPDVRAALAAAPVLYGGDPRALDGQVDQVQVDGKVIEIGMSCDDPICDIPPGVEEFRNILVAVAEQELATDCDLAE